MGEATPVFPGEWPLTFPRTERGGRKPAPRRRAGGSRGRDGEKTEGSARSGESRFFTDATSGLPRLPLDPNARRCQGRNERCGPRAGLSAGCAAADKDKRSSPVSAETAAGWLRAPHRARSAGTGDGPTTSSVSCRRQPYDYAPCQEKPSPEGEMHGNRPHPHPVRLHWQMGPRR